MEEEFIKLYNIANNILHYIKIIDTEEHYRDFKKYRQVRMLYALPHVENDKEKAEFIVKIIEERMKEDGRQNRKRSRSRANSK